MSIVGNITFSSVDTPVYWANASAVPVPLKLNGGTNGQAIGINSLGQIVGRITSAGVQTPVYWADYLALPTPLKLGSGGERGSAFGINSLGQIVGQVRHIGVFKSAYWADYLAVPTFLNGLTDTGSAIGINSLGQIVGRITSAGVQTPAYWDDYLSVPTVLNLIGVLGSIGEANGINSLGQIVGARTGFYDGIDIQVEYIPLYWADASAVPTPLTFLTSSGTDGTSGGINSLGQIVGSITYASVRTPVIWANFYANPTSLNLNGGSGGSANGIQDPPEAEPISNICFPEGTPIKTDQGIVNIELLDERTHTIGQKSILHITKTTTMDKYLIRFEKNALGRNVPDKKTIMTKDHQIMFEGRLVPAYRFLDYTDQVKKVKYSGETLYNVLLKEHGLMNVNNLLCETLHPDNIIAKLYTTNYSDEERSSIVYQMNTALLNNDVLTYKAVVDRLTLML